ncbi:TetR/AcrR family transcriptional regulator [Nocardia farcinica]|uniref:TetR/AcrR family transcriptional regulator n=1 Tax=Nocardia farcinica TaxID=37329 RepID=UPI0024574F6F|nr:TetR/AcrR family transcriptional regulator [Nocardia farcinica]
MPRPRSLTGADLVRAALAVIDRDGLSALTMRAVAKELGMATMALYRYVPDRDGLERLIVDSLFESVDVCVPADTPWRERVILLLDRLRAAVAAHPETVPLLLAHRQSSPTSLRWMEAMLGVLTEAGFDGAERVIAQRTLVAFLLGFLQNEHYASVRGRGTAVIAELPEADYPHLTATARTALRIAPDEEFRGGAQIVLRGLRPD